MTDLPMTDSDRELTKQIEAGEIEPHWDEDLVPHCSEEGCRQYDGKRCKMMGFRPCAICEPAVISTMAILKSDLVYKRAMESMAKQFIHPKMTALEMAEMQLRDTNKGK